MCLYSPVFFFRFASLCFRMPRITWLTNYYFTSADVSLLAHFFVFHLRHFNGAELLFSPTTAPFVNLKTHCILLHDYTIHHFEGICICQKTILFSNCVAKPEFAIVYVATSLHYVYRLVPLGFRLLACLSTDVDGAAIFTAYSLRSQLIR